MAAKKKNPFLARLDEQHAEEMRYMRLILLQQCKDMLLIAAHDEFGFGAERLKRLGDRFDATFTEYATDVLKDAKDDKQIWYSVGKYEEKLQEICGEHYVPHEERFA